MKDGTTTTTIKKLLPILLSQNRFICMFVRYSDIHEGKNIKGCLKMEEQCELASVKVTESYLSFFTVFK